jgi:hypothetical protein
MTALPKIGVILSNFFVANHGLIGVLLSTRYLSESFCNMRHLSHFLLIFVLSQSVLSRPLPIQDAGWRPKISWRQWIPTLGAVGILGGIIGIVFLGTKADEAYKAAEVVKDSEITAKYSSLPTRERIIISQREGYIGKELSREEAKMVEVWDITHGWPDIEMPDSTGMNRAARKELGSVHRKLQNAVNTAILAQEERQKTSTEAEKARKQMYEAQHNAAVIIATDWKSALRKAKESIT